VFLPIIENAFTGTVIRYSVKLAEAASHGVPVDDYCRNCFGYRDYESFAQEVIAQESTRLIPEAPHPGIQEVSMRERNLLEQLRLPSAPIATSKDVGFTLEAAGA
jgi:hypothetical protein